MPGLTRRALGLAGMGAALAGCDAGRPAGAAGARTPLLGSRPMGDPGRVRLKEVASLDLRDQMGDWLFATVTSMAWSPDGSRLVVESGLGNSLHVIDTASWRLLTTFGVMPGTPNSLFGFAAGGREVIASKRVEPGSTENPPAFSVFDMDTGRVVRESERLPVFLPDLLGQPHNLRLQQRRGQDLAVSPDGRFVFLCFSVRVSNIPRVFSYVFDGESGRLLGAGQGRHWRLPAISRDNRLAVPTLTHRGNIVPDAITIHSLPSLTPLLSFHAHERGVASLAWSPTGDRLVSGSEATTPPRDPEAMRVWNAATGEQLAVFFGEFEPVRYLDWHPSGGFFVSKSAKGTGERGSLLQLLPANGGAPLLQHFAPDRVVITAPCFCPRTGRLAWHQQGRISIWEIQGL